MTLAACSLLLAACARYPEAWSLHLLSVNFYLGAKLLPAIAHDLELGCDGLQLARGSVTNFYCEFFHVFILSFFCVCFMALEACGFLTLNILPPVFNPP